jgi:putative zinc finger/helix-turn-helix YgiT family protein
MAKLEVMNQCTVCGGAMGNRKSTMDKPYRYEMSGLDNVFLAGIEVRFCSGCGVEVPIIPRMAELHQKIAKFLLSKQDLLNGKEIKFLRKNAGIPQNEFAALIEIDASHLSRVENGKTDNLGAATDKLARAVVLAAGNGEDLRKMLLEIAHGRLKERKAVFTIRRDHWEKMKMAA